MVERYTYVSKCMENYIILIPINIERHHWYLIVVHVQNKQLFVLDSLGNACANHHVETCANIGRFFNERFGTNHGWESFKVSCPRQRYCDCGAFTCLNALCVSFGLSLNYDPTIINDFRKHMVLTVRDSPPVEIHTSVEITETFDLDAAFACGTNNHNVENITERVRRKRKKLQEEKKRGCYE